MPFFVAQRTVAIVLSLVSLCRAHTSIEYQSPVATSLHPVIPDCAWCCVEAFIMSEYPPGSCSDTQDVNCLCRTNTTSGFTLGEAALRCAVSLCPWDAASDSNIFGICSSVAGALPITHATITATIVATTSAAVTRTYSSTSIPRRSACPVKTSSVSRTTSVASTSRVSSSRPSPTTLVSMTKTTYSVDESRSTFHPSASASSTGSPSSLSMPAVVGVSVASGISAAFVIGVVMFFCIRKVRRKYMGNRDSFEIGGKMAEPPNFLQSPPKKMTPGPDRSFGGGIYNSGPTQLGSPIKLTTRGPLVVVTNHVSDSLATAQAGEIGIAMSPETEHGSPESPSSQRTLSALLPEKPNYTLSSGTLQPSHQDSRSMSGETLFDEDIERRPRDLLGPSYGVTSSTAAVAVKDRYTGSESSPQNFNLRPTIGMPSGPRAMMFVRQNRPNLPALRSSEQPMRLAYQSPRQATQPSHGTALSQSGKQLNAQSDYPSQPSQNTGSDRRRNRGRESPRESVRRLPVGSRNNNRWSEGSDTSFESIGIDKADESPDWSSSGVKRLSPVRETWTLGGGMQEGRSLPYPTRSCPVRYPKVPRSASVSLHAEVASMPRPANVYRNKSPQGGSSQPAAGPTPYPRDSRPTPPLRCLTPQEQPTIVKMPLPFLDSSPRSRSASPAGTLLAKRRGESVADKMESGLNIPKGTNSKPKWKVVKEESESGTGSGQKQQGHTAAGRESPDSTGSPQTRNSLWERNLTPSRRGDDLILSVDSV
ncbi:hypothetical protein VTN02DRAFT_3104 [Thermoascus thermophilus]